ncbi:hypothetical protein BHU72_14575 [Desulfuribacillus stibiiarsenatis]|uniref:Uncharacterized protein n=1 Tax=Desulfuribacillus stibiiarsenatis TaxID=1390249 RepID=A0A1E5L7B2_9FIRM|nr:hypothetical protein [Desulfuribacillus stibiiarsenatis]OEH86052.1 hypothetical protein BHU72_14575 [Desulfuribacillus stibiiarsenatis]
MSLPNGEKQLKQLYIRQKRYLEKIVHPDVRNEIQIELDMIKDQLIKVAKNKEAISNFLSEQLVIDECQAPSPKIYEKKVVQWLKGEYISALKEMKHCLKRSEDKKLYVHNLPNNTASYSDLERVVGGEIHLSKSEKVLIRLEEKCDEFFARYLELKLKVDDMEKILSCLTLEQKEVVRIKYIEPFTRGQNARSDEETIAELPFEKTYFYERKLKSSALAALANALGYM